MADIDISSIPSVNQQGVDISSIPSVSAAPVDIKDIPSVKPVKPEEVAVDPKNPDIRGLATATGIDYDLASKSPLFDHDALVQQYKDKNPGIVNNAAITLGGSSPVASGPITNFVEGATHTLGNWYDTVAKAVGGNSSSDKPTQAELDEIRKTDPEGAANLEAATSGNVNPDADNAARKLQEAVNANINERIINKGANINAQGNYVAPTATKVGNVVGNVVPGVAAGSATAAALPEVAAGGLVGFGLNTVRAATIGGVGGAASEPQNPVHGAEVGAITGGAVNTLAAGAGGVVRAISKNTPEQMRDIANTSDALVGENANGVQGAGTAEVLGRPNLTGERSISNLQNVTIPAWLPFGNTVKNATNFLTGAAKSQGEKLMGTETAAAQSTIEGGNWLDTLKNEPALQTEQAKLDMHDPSKFAEYYPQLSDAGKVAAVKGMLNNAYADAVQKGNGLLDLPTFNQHLKDMIDVTGDTSYIKGYSKWSLQGLQKLTEMSINPSVTTQQIRVAVNNLGPKGPGAAILTGATGLLDDVFSTGAGHTLQAPMIYNLANRALDSRPVRDALIDLASAKSPTQTITALSAINASMNKQD